MNNELIPRDTVTKIVAHRNAAIEEYKRFFSSVDSAHEHLRKAQELVSQACGGNPFSLPYVDRHREEIEGFLNIVKPPNVKELETVATRLTDIQVWSYIVTITELESLMDREAKEELRKQMAYVHEDVDKWSGQIINKDEMKKSLPPISEDTILATIEGFAERSGEIWQRGIANAFSALDRRFRSHDGFSIGHRIIFERAFDSAFGSWCYHSNHRDRLLDVERIFLILDGKGPRAPYAGIVGMIDAERKNKSGGVRKSVHEGEYFRVRIFQNGNMHLWFTRDDLVDRVNLTLAEYYNKGLGWGKSRDAGEAPRDVSSEAIERGPAKKLGQFFTPDALADRVINEAMLWSDVPLKILDPSAGSGQLARRAVHPYKEKYRNHVTVIEIDPDLFLDLKNSGLYARYLNANFLKVRPILEFDRVLMNPPFDRLRDVDHVDHALKFLKPGGWLLSIMSASAEFSGISKAVKFRDKIKLMGGRWTDLPDGQFRECGTNVNTCLLKVMKK